MSQEIRIGISVDDGNSVKKIQDVVIQVDKIGEATKKAAKPVKDLNVAVKQTGESAAVAADSVENLEKIIEQMTPVALKSGKALLGLVDSEDKVATSADAAAAATDKSASAKRRDAKASREAAVAASAAAKSQQQYAAAAKAAAAAAEEEEAAQDRLEKVQAQFKMVALKSSMLQDIAQQNYSKTYKNLAKWESLGTPAILKSATWSALGIGGLAYEGIKQYSQFNQLITQTVTQAGQSSKNLPFLTQSALDIAKQTGISLNDVANMMYRAASGTAAWNNGLGATKKQLYEVTKVVAQLNVLGNISGGVTSEQSARVVTALVNANVRGVGSGVQGVHNAAYLINAAVGAGDIRQSELVSALGRGVLTSAKANGMSAQDAVSWIDLLTSLGTTGSVAGTYVKSGINLLTNPSTQGNKALGMLGVAPGDFQQIMAGRQKYQGYTGLMGVTLDLKHALTKFDPFKNYPKYKGAVGAQGAINLLENWGINQIPKNLINSWKNGVLDKAQQMQVSSLILTKAFGGSKQFATIASLVENPDKLLGIENAIKRTDTAAAYKASMQLALDTPANRFHRMLRTLQVDLISFGKAITPYALDLGNAIGGLVGFFTKFKILLLPILGIMTSLIGLATFSKMAGIIRGSYPLLGKGQMALDKMWLGLAGGKENSFFRKLSGGGQQFRNAAITEEALSMKKLGMSALEASNALGNLAVTASGETAVGAGGAVASVASNEAALLNKSQEAKLLMGGQVIKTGDVKEAMGLSRRAKNTDAIYAQTEKLRRLQTAGGTITQEGAQYLTGAAPVAAAAVTGEKIAAGAAGAVAAEGVAAAGVGAAELAGGGVLSVLGGPIGVGIMLATTLPIVLPMLSNLFKGGGGSSPYKTPSTIYGFEKGQANTKIGQLNKKQKAGLSAFVADLVAGKNVNKDITKMQKLGIQGKYWQSLLLESTGSVGLKNNIKAISAMQMLQSQLKKGDALYKNRGTNPEGMSAPGFGFYKGFLSQNKKYIDQLSPDQKKQFLASMTAAQEGRGTKIVESTLSKSIGQNQDYLNLTYGTQLGTAAPKYLADTLKSQQLALANTFSKTKPTTALGVVAATQQAMQLNTMAKNDLARAAGTKDKGAAAEYRALAAQLRVKADALSAEASAEKAKLGISDESIRKLAEQIANLNKDVYTQAGSKTAKEFASAMISALSSGSVYIAKLANSGNSTIAAHGNH